MNKKILTQVRTLKDKKLSLIAVFAIFLSTQTFSNAILKGEIVAYNQPSKSEFDQNSARDKMNKAVRSDGQVSGTAHTFFKNEPKAKQAQTFFAETKSPDRGEKNTHSVGASSIKVQKQGLEKELTGINHSKPDKKSKAELAMKDSGSNQQGKTKLKPSSSAVTREKKIMDKIYVNFLDLLNLSVSTKALTDSNNKNRISEEISALEDLATQLSEHPKSFDFAYIVSNFQRDTKELSHTWKAGRYRESQFIIRSLTDNCISCHTSTRSPTDSTLEGSASLRTPARSQDTLAKPTEKKDAPTNLAKQNLFQGIDDKNLNLIEKAQLKTALREFSAALDTYELAFTPANLSAYPGLMLEGYLTDYVIVALRVKQDPNRVLTTLEKIYLDPSIPYSLSLTMKNWISTLKKFKTLELKSLDDIEKFVAEGNQKSGFPLDSGSIITNILAVNEIQNMLAKGDLSATDQARSYLITGICELSINRPLQISRANYYLEKAIVNAPKTDFAKKAYYYLESNIFYENSGSLGIFVPHEELEKLKSLKKLIE